MQDTYDGKLPRLTVSELTSLIKTSLEGSFFGLTVEGEISGFRPAATGHWYFTLKDAGAVVVLCGVLLSLVGIVFVGLAGRLKEREMSVEEQRKAVPEFNFGKGVLTAAVAGGQGSDSFHKLSERAADSGLFEVR